MWDAIKLWLRIAGAQGAVMFVTKLLENLGLLELPPIAEMYLGAVLAALLAWLRNKFGDVLDVRASASRRTAAFILRAVGAKL